MAKNAERFDEIRRAKGVIESQAFTKQNLRALRQMKFGASKIFRLLDQYQHAEGEKPEGTNEMLQKARSYLKTMTSVVDADSEESTNRFHTAISKGKELFERAANAEKKTKLAAKMLWKKGIRQKISERAKQWQKKKKKKKKKREKPREMEPVFNGVQLPPPPPPPTDGDLRVKLPTFKENLASGAVASAKKAALEKRAASAELKLTGDPAAEKEHGAKGKSEKEHGAKGKSERKKKRKTQREKMTEGHLNLQKKLQSIFEHAKKQSVLSIDTFKLHEWAEISSGYKGLLKQDVSNPVVQKRMNEYEGKMKKLIVKPARVTDDKRWAKTLNENTFRVFNAQFRMATFGESQKKIKQIEADLTSNKLTTMSAWKEIMTMMHKGRIPPGWTMDHQMVKSVLRKSKAGLDKHLNAGGVH
jgi:hypothetical protein